MLHKFIFLVPPPTSYGIMGDATLRLQKRIVASLVMPHKRDGKSAVISADGLNGDGTFAVMVKAEVHRRQNAVIVFSDG